MRVLCCLVWGGAAHAIGGRILELYPKFEETGWRAQSEHRPPPAVVQELQRFFAPYNRALYAYLGR